MAIQNPMQIMMETPDPQQNFVNFGELVIADRELHNRLRATGSEDFIALVVQLGQERGYVFTAAVVETAIRAQRRVWLERWL
jgi:hypothetical protein